MGAHMGHGMSSMDPHAGHGTTMNPHAGHGTTMDPHAGHGGPPVDPNSSDLTCAGKMMVGYCLFSSKC